MNDSKTDNGGSGAGLSTSPSKALFDKCDWVNCPIFDAACNLWRAVGNGLSGKDGIRTRICDTDIAYYKRRFEDAMSNAQISGGTPSAESDCWQSGGDK